MKLEYGYGTATQNNGSMKSQRISFNGLVQAFEQTYTYDDLNRLQQAKEVVGTAETWKETFTIDRSGNREFDAANTTTLGSCPQTVCNPDINPANNRFLASQGYGYDENGNVTQDATGQRFGYDAENHQKEFFIAGNSSSNPDATYAYDGDGRRVKKISSTETTVFVYNAIGQLVAEYSTQIETANPQTSYLTTDHLGSPRVITDKTGNVLSRRDFMPFGEELGAGVGTRTTNDKYSVTGADNVRKRYTGYEKDQETQLDFAEARMYENRHGRFTAVDPLLASGKSSNPQTFNRYVYTSNNPIARIDPDGNIWGTFNHKVQWFKSRAAMKNAGYSEFRPENWTYESRKDGRIVKLSPNSPRWHYIGDYIGGEKRAAKPQPTAYVNHEVIKAVNKGLDDIKIGSINGIKNTGIDLFNFATDAAVNTRSGIYMPFQNNPFAIEKYAYTSELQAKWGTGFQVGLTVGPSFAGSVFSASSTLSVVPRNTSLYRAVSQSELADIGLVRGFRPDPSGRNYQLDKLFARSSEDAAQFGRNNFRLDGQPFFVVETQAPGSVMTNSVSFTADSMRAVSVQANQLNQLTGTRFVNFCSICR